MFLLVSVMVIFFRHSYRLSPYNPYIRGKGKQPTVNIDKNTQSLKNSLVGFQWTYRLFGCRIQNILRQYPQAHEPRITIRTHTPLYENKQNEREIL